LEGIKSKKNTVKIKKYIVDRMSRFVHQVNLQQKKYTRIIGSLRLFLGIVNFDTPIFEEMVHKAD